MRQARGRRTGSGGISGAALFRWGAVGATDALPDRDHASVADRVCARFCSWWTNRIAESRRLIVPTLARRWRGRGRPGITADGRRGGGQRLEVAMARALGRERPPVRPIAAQRAPCPGRLDVAGLSRGQRDLVRHRHRVAYRLRREGQLEVGLGHWIEHKRGLRPITGDSLHNSGVLEDRRGAKLRFWVATSPKAP